MRSQAIFPKVSIKIKELFSEGIRFDSQMVTVAGWGVTVQVDKDTVIDPSMVPSEPYEVNLTVLPTLGCDLYTDQPSILCAGLTEPGKGMCTVS